MTTLSISPFSFFTRPFWKPEATAVNGAQKTEIQRRQILSEMIAAGACDSEYGVQMLMSVYPDQF
ncbi:hypothetical protein NBRC116601_17130 [Cognatishimia sp. WU-CL00825]|uniref:hypothetical protein n=1 Tax=Cognatishimia sp. WU-CL00825 TaxID=3127658 RepID=UPI0031094630